MSGGSGENLGLQLTTDAGHHQTRIRPTDLLTITIALYLRVRKRSENVWVVSKSDCLNVRVSVCLCLCVSIVCARVRVLVCARVCEMSVRESELRHKLKFSAQALLNTIQG